ncbi:reverse transcriptase [Plakobranchus ocellatus]|uniref:Reverse transcriptase n=1 Tax=Plakobranchus ocellatus TaxID=259542 RepID=A0AAV4DKL7_9GAST|nr:reverse transcriptase [Plakobranchus ocellatus]
MAAGVALQLGLVTFLTILVGVEGWRCAKYQHYFSQQPDYIECVWDCCGNSFNRHCCAPIGIIVGCSIVGAVVVAALIVLLACWWQRRRSRYNKGPRLFHNRKHSHYPVAPTSVTRPAPLMPYRGGPESEGQMYRPPPTSAYRPRPGAPSQAYDPEKKVPPTDFYEPDPPRGPPQGQGYRQGPPVPGHAYRQGPPPQRPPVREYFD